MNLICLVTFNALSSIGETWGLNEEGRLLQNLRDVLLQSGFAFLTVDTSGSENMMQLPVHV